MEKDSLKHGKQCVIHDVRYSCNCSIGWSVNTNKFISEHEPLICEKCDGYITVDQIPAWMKFNEQLGTY